MTVAASGHGTVAVDPPSLLYPYDAAVRLVARPAEGNYFAAWSGNVAGDANPLPILVRDANAIASALFLPLPVGKAALTVVPEGNGRGALGRGPISLTSGKW